MTRKCLLFIVGSSAYFMSHRAPIAKAALADGYEVHVATPGSPESALIDAAGFHYHEVAMSRGGTNPVEDAYTLMQLVRLIRAVRPDLVHVVAIKPVIYGSIAARLCGLSAVVAAVSGLGAAFIADGFKARIIRHFIMVLYKVALRGKNTTVIFQNTDDRDLFLDHGIVWLEQTTIIRGSGVDLTQYPVLPEPPDDPVILMASRLLADKGVWEYVEAATILRKNGAQARFLLAGDIDPENPASLTKQDLSRIEDGGNVRLLGYRSDMPQLLAAANIVVLPSYREGLPKVLIEAAASGRAVVTTDVPGCRDAIEHGLTGLLVPVCSGPELARAIGHLIDDPDTRRQFGAAGRQLAERVFDIERVVEDHLAIYNFAVKEHRLLD